MFKSLLKPKSLKWGAALLALAGSIALVWFTVNAPQPGNDPQAQVMVKESATFFAVERDMSALARDVQTGAARDIGLATGYVLVSRTDGSRYYVRADARHALVSEILKNGLSSPMPAVFALGDVQPPAAPLSLLVQQLKDPLWISLLGPLLIIYLILVMNPLRASLFKTARRPATKFSDVIGVADAKDALQDIVAYLRKPAKFSALGARPPKGIVLEGDSGAGKTLLARAVAGEAGVPFIALAGSDFSDMFLGVGVRRVKKLFELARRQAPCVVFIDEIDGLGRRSGAASAAETENNRIINTLLVELDGFSPTSGIVVMGATNNVGNLDPAMIRPGRFDRICNLALPSVDEREALFALYAGQLRTAGDTDFRPLARLATGLSPAAIANAVNAAALLAAKEDAAAVTERAFRARARAAADGRAAAPPAKRR